MGKSKTILLRSALAAVHYSGAGRALAPLFRGDGAIFMLHHVSPDPVPAFAPNRLLTITPDYLEHVIVRVKAAGFEIVTLDEACRRMRCPEPGRAPFVTFTFDDGYRDNRDHAMPVLERHGVPLTLYVCPEFADGTGELWWLTLEEVIRRVDSIKVPAAMQSSVGDTLRTRTTHEKYQAFERLYWPIRTGDERAGREVVRELAESAGVDPLDACRRLAMNWNELAELANNPLVTIGAHTMSHLALGKLSESEARYQMSASIARIRHELDLPCRHFCYPYGDIASAGPREFAIARNMGVGSAVTTAKGMINADRPHGLTALPRVSLNGEYQRTFYLEALLSGLPFACYDLVARARRFAGRSEASGHAPVDA